MRIALALLDGAGESLAAIHLSHAIDVATGAPVPRTVEEAEAALEFEIPAMGAAASIIEQG